MIKTINDIGNIKSKIKSMLYANGDIQHLLFNGSIPSGASKKELFNKLVKTHLFIDDTITDTGSFIYFDTSISDLHYQTKTMRVHLYAITHRDLLDNYTHDYYVGNRADVLAEEIADTLTNEKNSNEFGIGEISLMNVDIYNSESYYGRILTFEVKNFR